MNFKNSLLVTVPEGVQELEVMKAIIFKIMNNGFSIKSIIAGFLYREQQRWIGYWDRHCRRPQWVCPHPCFHHHPIKKGRNPQKTLSLPSSPYYFICHYHLHINQSDKKHDRPPKCARADRTFNYSAKFQPPIPMSSAWGVPKAKGGLFL